MYAYGKNKMEDTSIGVLVFATILALSSLRVSGFILDNLQNGDVRLVGSSKGLEGRAEVYYDGDWRGICFSSGAAVGTNQHQFELPEADVFCKQLGFTDGAALVLNGNQTAERYGKPSDGVRLTSVDCSRDTTADGILDCEQIRWGSECDDGHKLGYSGVVCHIPGYIGCYRYDTPGFLLDHEIISETMTLDACIDACLKSPGPFRYAGVRQHECTCGADGINIPTIMEHDHQCYEACPGDEYQQCGAYLRTAVYDLDIIEDGHVAPHIIWPSWGRNYNAGDDDKIWRVTIPADYDYAVLYILSFNLADEDSITLRSEARQYGAVLTGNLNLDLPERWVTNTADWFEVETNVLPNTPGDEGVIIYYQFGKHCYASDLPIVEGGNWQSLTGVYYERECPLPICLPGYQGSSGALCQLDGTWVGNGSCSRIPTTKRPLFPIDESTAIRVTQPDSTTIAPVTPVTQLPPPPPTQAPPPPQTQPPPAVPTTREPLPPPPVRTDPPLPPIAQCYRPNINTDTGVLEGTGYKAVFYEGDRITHCCTHKNSDCVELVCLSSRRWSNAAYLERCPAAVCVLPETDENGSLQNPGGRTYFRDDDEIGLCCINSNYCFVLKCRTDGTWENGEELLQCPRPLPVAKKYTALPVWVIVVVIIAAIFGLAIITICLIVCLRSRPGGHGVRRTYVKRPSPYYIKPKGGYRNPAPPRHLRDPPRDRSPSPSRRRHRSPIRKDPVVIGTPIEGLKNCRDYAQYGANPIIICGGTKYAREAEKREAEKREAERREAERREHDDHHPHPHHHSPEPQRHHHHPHHPEPHYHEQSPRRERSSRQSDDRRRRDQQPRDKRDRRHHHHRHGRREEEEASALGVLNSVVRDLQQSATVPSDAGSVSDGSSHS
ncbi:uncharacterized protein [Amphiura filiformis]|uniref:uncharacterized protein n=1 Tax=Amphiura filiformis TaxID=82378 RepID=UPI003B21E1F2